MKQRLQKIFKPILDINNVWIKLPLLGLLFIVPLLFTIMPIIVLAIIYPLVFNKILMGVVVLMLIGIVGMLVEMQLS